MTRSDLEDQVAIVTGGGSGIGNAIARGLAELGVRCALVGRRARPLDDAVAKLATPGLAVAADLIDHSTHERILEQTAVAFGQADIVVHAAGIFEKNAIQATSDEFWERVMSVNLSAVMAFTRCAWPTLQATSGQILMVSSYATRTPFAGNAAYAASKAGLNALAEVLTLEGREDGIRVITIAPGQTDTPIWDGLAPDDVRSAMMPPSAVGDLAAALLASHRGMEIAPVFVRPVDDPWKAASE
jgi:NAD(P)-dependent dehydrogenase (short-subunit alcohol dehydrogenase family)